MKKKSWQPFIKNGKFFLSERAIFPVYLGGWGTCKNYKNFSAKWGMDPPPLTSSPCPCSRTCLFEIYIFFGMKIIEQRLACIYKKIIFPLIFCIFNLKNRKNNLFLFIRNNFSKPYQTLNYNCWLVMRCTSFDDLLSYISIMLLHNILFIMCAS